MFAVYTIYQDHEHLIPDAPELLDTFLAAVSNFFTYQSKADLVVGIRLYMQAQRVCHSL